MRVTIGFRRAPDSRVSIQILSSSGSELLGDCLFSLAHSVQTVDYEVMVLLNGAPRVTVDALIRRVSGAHIFASEVNLGFAGGHNFLAERGRGDLIVLLNDDTTVEDEWLDHLVDTVDRRQACGIVGSRILCPDGRLQEAGSVIWADGSTIQVGRGEDAKSLPYLFERPADYVSFSSALVSRAVWERLGGLPTCYFPAYYEDVDFSLAARKAGYSTWYQPASLVRHHGSQSTTSEFRAFLFERNREIFKGRRHRELAGLLAPQPTNSAAIQRAARRAGAASHRILLIDDRIPDPALGSGYGRELSLLEELSTEGHSVALYPTIGPADDALSVGRIGVEVLDRHRPLADHLANGSPYDAVIISRPNNWVSSAAVVRRHQPNARLIYDAEALWHARTYSQLELELSDSDRQRLFRDAEYWQEIEGAIGLMADHVVAITPSERDFFTASAGAERVSWVPPLPSDQRPVGPGLKHRRGLLFVAGWAAGSDSPNGDGLRWFDDQVLPRIAAEVPWVECMVTGAEVPTDLWSRRSPNLHFLGHVRDLASTHHQARAAVVPIRYGAGMHLKLVDALQHGLPVASTRIGARGIPLRLGHEIDVADEPAELAGHCIRLLTDDEYWSRQRQSLDLLNSYWSTLDFDTWSGVIERLLEPSIPAEQRIPRATLAPTVLR